MTDSERARVPVNSLRGLLPFLRPHRGLVALWLAALALSSTATLLLPVAVRHMIDQGFSSEGSVDRWFALLFAVAVLLALATAARFYFVTLLGERMVADLRRALYSHLLSLDMGFFERSRSSELLSRLSADTELLRSVVGSSMSVALRSLVTVLGSAVMLAVTWPCWPCWASRWWWRRWCFRAGACARWPRPPRTASPMPMPAPARPWAPCTPCRATPARPTRPAASARRWRWHCGRRAGASACRRR
jgi:ABC-type multidrug transport system fused ATPase/permease subunit